MEIAVFVEPMAKGAPFPTRPIKPPTGMSRIA